MQTWKPHCFFSLILYGMMGLWAHASPDNMYAFYKIDMMCKPFIVAFNVITAYSSIPSNNIKNRLCMLENALGQKNNFETRYLLK